jgi:hypothetical protein
VVFELAHRALTTVVHPCMAIIAADI